jgi:predicted ArsR family transcriptional regulator
MINEEHVRARASDPVTSHIAAGAADGLARRHAERILECLSMGPLGKDGIAHVTGLDGVAVARRLPELQRDGLADVTGKTAVSRTGRPEREWASTAWLKRQQ